MTRPRQTPRQTAAIPISDPPPDGRHPLPDARQTDAIPNPHTPKAFRPRWGSAKARLKSEHQGAVRRRAWLRAQAERLDAERDRREAADHDSPQSEMATDDQ
jgi:hypothetical protein